LLKRDNPLTSKNGITYIGRQPSSAPATGLGKTHLHEFEQFMKEAFL